MTTTRSHPNVLLTAALEAAGRGWPVFPCAPSSKRPAVRAWNTRATTDPDRIRTCWNSGRPFNIGVACGPAGLVVVDVDVAEQGETHPDGRLMPDGWTGLDGLDDLAVADRQRHGRTRGTLVTFTVATPSGGRHLYFRAPTAPEGMELRNTAGALGWKLDTRAAGGYVLAAGSRLPHGTYQPTADLDGRASQEVSELPEWLAEALTPPAPPPTPPAPRRPAALEQSGRAGRYLDAAVSAEVQRVISARSGTRNRDLYIAAVALGQLAAGGAIAPEQVAAVLLEASAGHVANGAFSDRQARDTIASGLRAGARRPRTLHDARGGGGAAPEGGRGGPSSGSVGRRDVAAGVSA